MGDSGRWVYQSDDDGEYIVHDGLSANQTDAAVDMTLYIAAVDPPTVLALLAVARDVAINHRPYTTVGIETAICPCCSDLEAGEVVLWEDCPHRPVVDALIALVGSRA